MHGERLLDAVRQTTAVTMRGMRFHPRRPRWTAVLATFVALPPLAGTATAAADEPLVLRALGSGVFWSKEGGNTGVVVARDGVIVFDATGSAARAAELQARIADRTRKPVAALILSHVDGDHAGGLAGFPGSVPVIVQRATRDLLGAAAGVGPATAVHARIPDIAIDSHRRMSLAGERVELHHWGPAHTSGDLVAWFPRLGVVFAADIFCMDQPRPYIKPELGGDSGGWLLTARAILALHPKWIVVGHGEPRKPEQLQAYVDTAERERKQVLRLAAQGMPLEQIESAVGEPQPSSAAVPPGIHEARFASAVYQEAVRTRQGAQREPGP